MLKILGALCIIGGSSAAGFGFAACVRRQAEQLRELSAALSSMRDEIEYRATPLPRLLSELSEQTAGAISELFRFWSEALTAACGASIPYALSCALRRTRRLTLGQDGLSALQTLAQSLGRFDAEAQLRAISLCTQRIENQIARLESEKPARCRSYRTIGVCAGLALAVILL